MQRRHSPHARVLTPPRFPPARPCPGVGLRPWIPSLPRVLCVSCSFVLLSLCLSVSVFALHEVFGRALASGAAPPLVLPTLMVLRELSASSSAEVRLNIAACVGKLGPTMTDITWLRVRGQPSPSL